MPKKIRVTVQVYSVKKILNWEGWTNLAIKSDWGLVSEEWSLLEPWKAACVTWVNTKLCVGELGRPRPSWKLYAALLKNTKAGHEQSLHPAWTLPWASVTGKQNAPMAGMWIEEAEQGQGAAPGWPAGHSWGWAGGHPVLQAHQAIQSTSGAGVPISSSCLGMWTAGSWTHTALCLLPRGSKNYKGTQQLCAFWMINLFLFSWSPFSFVYFIIFLFFFSLFCLFSFCSVPSHAVLVVVLNSAQHSTPSSLARACSLSKRMWIQAWLRKKLVMLYEPQ